MEEVSASEMEINIFILKFVNAIEQISSRGLSSSQSFTNQWFAVQAAFEHLISEMFIYKNLKMMSVCSTAQ